MEVNNVFRSVLGSLGFQCLCLCYMIKLLYCFLGLFSYILKQSPHLLRLFRRMLQHCSAMKLYFSQQSASTAVGDTVVFCWVSVSGRQILILLVCGWHDLLTQSIGIWLLWNLQSLISWSLSRVRNCISLFYWRPSWHFEFQD